jgi:hypothetical protein
MTVPRLFPWVPDEGEHRPELHRANGRIDPPDRPRLSTWSWHGTPRRQWDGTEPTAMG